MPRPRALSNEVTFRVHAVLRARNQSLPGARPEGLRPNLILGKAEDGPAVLRIYDAIGGWFGITASDVAEALDGIKADRDLVVRINSPGGDVFDGTAIFNLLATREGQVDVVVDGLAASAASFIAQAGDTITMNRGTQMMIHDAHGFTIGNAGDHRQMADLLDGVSDEIAGIYASRAGLTKAEWRAKMREESWYNAEAAVEAGLADRTADDEDQDEEEAQKAAASWNLRPAAAARRSWSQELAACATTDLPVTPEQVADQHIGDDAWTELGDEALAGLAATLDELFDPMAGYDPADVGALIADVYANAPATPAVDPGPAPPRTTIPIDEFLNDLVTGIQEGVRP